MCRIINLPRPSIAMTIQSLTTVSSSLTRGVAMIFQQWNCWLMVPNIDLPVNRIQRTFPFCSGGLHFGSKVGLKKVNFLSESSPVAEILRSGTSRTPTLMSLVRYLCLLAACYSFPFTAFPVTEKPNPIADSLLPFQFSALPLASP